MGASAALQSASAGATAQASAPAPDQTLPQTTPPLPSPPAPASNPADDAPSPAIAERPHDAPPPPPPSSSSPKRVRSSKAPPPVRASRTNSMDNSAAPAGSAEGRASANATAPPGALAGTSLGADGAGGGGQSADGNDSGVREPVLTSFAKPAYPRRSRQAGEEGKVVVEAHISARGTLLQAVVLQSSGYLRLDEAARSSLVRARFQPALRQGRPVEGRLRVPFVFNLRDEEGA